MTAFDRREYAGGAPSTTLASDITSGGTSISLTDGTGYPTGGTGNFYIVIDPGLPAEEKILCSGRSTNTVTVATSGRGADDTSASAHSAGAVVQHVATARDLDEANQHYSDTALDHHTQYLNTTRHAAVSHTTAMIGDSQVTTAKIADDAITSAKIAADAVGTSEIAANAVGSSELADNAVDTAAIADDAVTAAKIAAGAVGSSEIAADAVGTSELADAAVDTAAIVDDAVTSAKIADGAVGYAALAGGVAWTCAPAQGATGGDQPTALTTVDGLTYTITDPGYDIEWYALALLGVTPETQTDVGNLWETQIDGPTGTPQGILRIPVVANGQSLAVVTPVSTHSTGTDLTTRVRTQRTSGSQSKLTVASSTTRTWFQVFWRRKLT